MTQGLQLKDTLLLPKTSFPMKANLPQKEPELVKFWKEQRIYYKLVETNKKNPVFTLADGPIYANGAIHIGHSLNRILKDIIVKYKNMKGFYCEFIPGWDCHGLPIEITTSKKLGSRQKELSSSQFRSECRKEAYHWHMLQKEEFQRLGTIGDWDNPYLTLQPQYEADEVRLLKHIHRNEFLFLGKKPVHWSAQLGTALAASEIIYKDVKSPAIDVLFPITSSALDIGEQVHFVIWTTTPWTLPANTAIAVGKSFTYSVYSQIDSSKKILIAEDLKESLEKKWNLKLKKEKTFQGSELVGTQVQHPFLEKKSVVVLGDHVELGTGTGCVHIAPGHGLEDYTVGFQNNLQAPCPVNKYGKFTNSIPAYEGLLIWKANPMIIEDLKQKGNLLHHEEIHHSYPHDERTKNPTFFRLTSQWFIAVESQNQKLKKQALETLRHKVNFVPSWGKQRFEAMIESNPDWCISRQRLWGVPLPVFYCQKCQTPLIEEELLENVAKEIEKHPEGSNVFYEKSAAYWTKNYHCKACGHNEFTKSQDILDVWFDSAAYHTAVQKRRAPSDFPTELYLEGSDQHRGWFQSSFLSSLSAYQQSPFKTVLTHGFVNDAKGHKMSKSRGNVISPQKVIQQYGAEILRLWAAHEDYSRDLTASMDIFKRLSESYRKIRNTFRFILGNINDFNILSNKVSFEDMTPLDQWILVELNEQIKSITEHYDNFQFHKSYHKINEFFTVTLSSLYLDILKDRLYTSGKNSLQRRSGQTALWFLYTHLLRMMAPILSFTAEEIYQMPQSAGKESVFLEPFPEIHETWNNKEVKSHFRNCF